MLGLCDVSGPGFYGSHEALDSQRRRWQALSGINNGVKVHEERRVSMLTLGTGVYVKDACKESRFCFDEFY